MGAFDVRIVSHELKEDDNGNMYAKYAIRVTDEVSGHTWVLQRRFREIRRLHKLLRNAYHGVPKCPSRKLFGHSNDRFLQKRKGELEFFLMIIIDLPYVYRHPAGREFFEFEHHMKALSATDESDTEAISQTPHVTFGPATVMSPASRQPRVASSDSVGAEARGTCQVPTSHFALTQVLKERFLCGLKPVAMFCSTL
eukprot:GEMP01044233.1.p1 GENE.GEMP01044233.1~~GEMP01044233.1.p1  ORF type:complete len:197 (+),score=25.15 GEMP01044233.1:174-764(+)